MSKQKAVVVTITLLAAIFTLSGCNTPSMADFERIESRLALLESRFEAAEARTNSSLTSAESALDSADQCNQICLQVSERLDEVYLETMPR